MLYETYQAHADAFAPVRLIADWARGCLEQPWPLFGGLPGTRALAAGFELVSRAGMSHQHPDFGIVETDVTGGAHTAVRKEVVHHHPFCDLLHFRKERAPEQPRILLVAPLSGHFATLLRDTVRTLLPEHDVYITDWINARNVALLHGRFDLDDYIDLIMMNLRFLGPKTHVIAVCQPSVPVLAAVSLLAAGQDPAVPASMTLMGGPIDTRAAPTAVSEFGARHSLRWFERQVIATVPARYPGAFRRVYPGFLQLMGFMSMNLDRHVSAHMELFRHLVRGDGDSAQATKAFYDEYMSVMDLPADFYLQTVERVFHRHALPTHRFVSRGRRVDPSAITKTALLCVEGEKDDICAVGQTKAALDLCTGLPASGKEYHLQHRVGHFGVFHGRRWREEIYPKVRDFIAASG